MDDFPRMGNGYVFANFADCQALPSDRLARGAGYMHLDSFDLNYQVLRGSTNKFYGTCNARREIFRLGLVRNEEKGKKENERLEQIKERRWSERNIWKARKRRGNAKQKYRKKKDILTRRREIEKKKRQRAEKEI